MGFSHLEPRALYTLRSVATVVHVRASQYWEAGWCTQGCILGGWWVSLVYSPGTQRGAALPAHLSTFGRK